MFLLSIDPGFNDLSFAYGALKATLDPKSGTIQPTVYIDKQRFKSINLLEMRGAVDHQEMCYAICKFFW